MDTQAIKMTVTPQDEHDNDHQFDRWNSATKYLDRSEQIQVGETFPEIYLKGGIMERGNFSACAGFSSCSGRCAVFGTFAAFQEMILSEASNWAMCSDFYLMPYAFTQLLDSRSY